MREESCVLNWFVGHTRLSHNFATQDSFLSLLRFVFFSHLENSAHVRKYDVFASNSSLGQCPHSNVQRCDLVGEMFEPDKDVLLHFKVDLIWRVLGEEISQKFVVVLGFSPMCTKTLCL